MKIVAAILGLCLIASVSQAQDSSSSSTAKEKGAKAEKAGKEAQMTAAEIDERIAKRQAELKEVTAKGRTDIAAGIQKIIAYLNAMKAALSANDANAFKTANEQRKKDHEALEAMRKADKAANPEKPAKKSSSSQAASSSLKS